MKPPQRVVWSEGMLVSPQHLQQQDLYHERLLDDRIAALSPYRWGVVSVEIDAGALGSDQLRLTRFVGVLPDGLYLGFEGQGRRVPGRPPHRRALQPHAAVLRGVSGRPQRTRGGAQRRDRSDHRYGGGRDQGGARPLPRRDPQRGRPDRERRRSADGVRAPQRRHPVRRRGARRLRRHQDRGDRPGRRGRAAQQRSVYPARAAHRHLTVPDGRRAAAAGADGRQAAPAVG